MKEEMSSWASEGGVREALASWNLKNSAKKVVS